MHADLLSNHPEAFDLASDAGALPGCADTASPPSSGSGQLIQQMKLHGLAPSANRLCVLQVLAAQSSPTAAADILRELLMRGTMVRSATLYRILADLLASGLIVDVDGRGTKGSKTTYSLAWR